MEVLNTAADLFLTLECKSQEYVEPTPKDFSDEFKSIIAVCGSCANFVFFMAEAGFCGIAEDNCLCSNPKAMIDMWDKKCDEWTLNPRELEEIVDSISGFTCPYCEQVSEMRPIAKTKVEFLEDQGTYEWDEVHECKRCNNLYIIKNGT